MFRPLVSALLVATALTMPAQAQSPAATAPTELQQSGLTPPTLLSQGYANSGEDVLVTQLLGESVYGSADADAAALGTISDLVVTAGEGISAAILSVGGVLGVGSKEVALDFSQLTWTPMGDGTRRWVTDTTIEELSAAPAFIWGDSEAVTGEPALSPQEEEEQRVEGDPNAVPVDPALTTDAPERPRITTQEDEPRPEELMGIGVFGINDEQVGSIGDVLIAPDGSIDAIIVDVGGFLGLGAKPVAVAYENLAISTDTFGNRYIFLNASREQLETQPAYNPATYDEDRDNQRMVLVP